MRQWRLGLGVVLACALFGVAACGQSEPSSPTASLATNAPPTTPPTAPSAATVAPPVETISAGAASGLPEGPVLLVAGYGGVSASVEQLQQVLSRQGRTAKILPAAHQNYDDLSAQAARLEELVSQELAAGAASVDLVGYSAGGLVVREWARRYPQHERQVRRVVTLGTPHHGTQLAAGAWLFDATQCPASCQQMNPNSGFLARLNQQAQLGQSSKLSVITNDDEVVTPTATSLWDGALNVYLQQVCTGVQVGHGQLPVYPLTVGLLLQFLSTPGLTQTPGVDQCSALQTQGQRALAGV